MTQDLGLAIECKSDAVAGRVYMIQYEDFNSNIDTDDILSLMNEWNTEYCMDAQSELHMREYYVINSQRYDTVTTAYTEDLSGEHADEYYKAMDGEIHGLTRRGKWEVVPRKSVADHNVHPGKRSFKCKRKPDLTIMKLKEQYCVRGDVQKIMYT